MRRRFLDALELLAQAFELLGDILEHPWLFCRHVIIGGLLLPLLTRYRGLVISLLVWWLLGPSAHSGK